LDTSAESGLFKTFQYSRKKVLDTSPYLQNIQVKNFYNIRTVVLKGKKIRKNLVKNFYNIRTVVLKGKKNSKKSGTRKPSSPAGDIAS
jgi:glutamine phosphoribosylpyrophosphate amidotransferase